MESIGCLDVTLVPFAADPTGATDSTAALRRAIEHARDHRLIAFFPPGRYLVSDTLDCEHGRYDRVNDAWREDDRTWACVLRGSTNGPRPRILLKPESTGFADPNHPKPVVHFWSRPRSKRMNNDAAWNMNQALAGIDVEIGEGNPGAIGVSHRAAQGSFVQDCTIDATHGYCGLSGGAGSGGSHAGVTVIGGRIGADLCGSQPAPVIVGFTLRGQTEAALLYHGQQALSAVGCVIEDQTGPVAVVAGAGEPAAESGQVCLSDSSIAFSGAGPYTAVVARASVYLSNVYVKGADKLIATKHGHDWQADPQRWTCIKEYVYAQEDRQAVPKGASEPFTYQACIYVDGVRQDAVAPPLTKHASPPADLHARHLWDEATFPSWEHDDAVNVKHAPYHAAGDGQTDDTEAIQRAIDAHRKVFLPTGDYAISRTLKLRPDTQLIGTHRCHVRLMPIAGSDGDFADPGRPNPLLLTADDPGSETILSAFSVVLPLAVTGAYGLRWRSGRRSIFRDVDVDVEPNVDWEWEKHLEPRAVSPPRNHPAVVIDGGAGRFYNFFQESWRHHGPDYRHLLIRNTDGPLHFYQCNPEHSRGAANMEVHNASHVTIYGVKSEGNTPVMVFRNCAHIRVIGYGGNASARPGEALFVMENCRHFLLANLVDKPRFGFGDPDHFGGRGQDPDQWFMVLDTSGDQTLRTEPRERPVLYKRGTP